MSDALERAHLAMLDATHKALQRRYKTACAWCRQTIVETGHPLSTGICDDCLDRHYPEERQ